MACCRRRRRAADVHVRDAGAVRGLAAEQAAAARAGRVPGRAGAQGNAGRAPRRARAARAGALPRVGAAAPPQLPGRAAVPQLLLGGSAADLSPRTPHRRTLPRRACCWPPLTASDLFRSYLGASCL